MIRLLTSSIGTAAAPEMAWTIVAACGLIFSLLVIHNAEGNLRTVTGAEKMLDPRDFDRMLTIARSHLINELLRVTAHGISMVAGIALMSMPPANPDRPVTQGGWVIAGVLIAKAALHVGASIKDWRTRTRLLNDVLDE